MERGAQKLQAHVSYGLIVLNKISLEWILNYSICASIFLQTFSGE